MAHVLSLPHFRSSRGGLISTLVRLDAAFRERSRLASLDDHLMRDIGMSESERRAQLDRTAWGAPDNWRR